MERFVRRMSTWVVCLAGAGVLLLGGCNPPKKHLSKFNEMVISGDCEGALCFSKGKIKEKDTPRGEDVLWSLQAAALERYLGNHAESNQLFDSAEEMMTHFDSENSSIGHNVGAVAINENIVPYTGAAYDGVMVNTYKALNFIALGRDDLARVEFNRALDRQRRSKDKFNTEIQKAQDEVNKDGNSAMVQQSLDSPDLRTKLEEAYPSMYNFKAYPDFVNPFATYMAGVFFAAEGDYGKAVDLLKESAGMVDDNDFVLNDLAAVEQALNTNRKIAPTVWVIFENGLGPMKEEFRIDLPIFIVTDRVQYVGIALPKLVLRPAAMGYLEVVAGAQTLQSQLVSNMDRVVQTEFDKDFKAILTRAIISTTAKAIAQYALYKNEGSWASVAMAVFNVITTAADVRIWTMLPKNMQVARVDKPADGQITIKGPALAPTNLQIPDCEHAIIYVKMIRAGLRPNVEMMTF